jgi:hypothetical protein
MVLAAGVERCFDRAGAYGARVNMYTRVQRAACSNSNALGVERVVYWSYKFMI